MCLLSVFSRSNLHDFWRRPLHRHGERVQSSDAVQRWVTSRGRHESAVNPELLYEGEGLRVVQGQIIIHAHVGYKRRRAVRYKCSHLKQLVCVFIDLFILFVQWNSNRKRTFISSIKLWYQTTAVKHLFYELNSDVKARSLTCWVTDSHSVMMDWLDLTCQTSTLSSHERCFKTEWASNVFQNLRQFVPSVLP